MFNIRVTRPHQIRVSFIFKRIYTAGINTVVTQYFSRLLCKIQGFQGLEFDPTKFKAFQDFQGPALMHQDPVLFTIIYLEVLGLVLHFQPVFILEFPFGPGCVLPLIG